MGNHRKSSAIRLWVTQGLLAALFCFAGAMKFIMPLAAMNLPIPVTFLRFIGVAEILGALGLVLPGLTNVARGLTPIAAAGLVAVMAGATTVTLPSGAAPALVPLFVGALAASVAYGRRAWLGDLAPKGGAAPRAIGTHLEEGGVAPAR